MALVNFPGEFGCEPGHPSGLETEVQCQIVRYADKAVRLINPEQAGLGATGDIRGRSLDQTGNEQDVLIPVETCANILQSERHAGMMVLQSALLRIPGSTYQDWASAGEIAPPAVKDSPDLIGPWSHRTGPQIG